MQSILPLYINLTFMRWILEIYLRLSWRTINVFFTPRLSSASITALACGPCIMTSIIGSLGVDPGIAKVKGDFEGLTCNWCGCGTSISQFFCHVIGIYKERFKAPESGHSFSALSLLHNDADLGKLSFPKSQKGWIRHIPRLRFTFRSDCIVRCRWLL